MNGNFKVTFIGGPTVILEIGGLRFITDPTLDPPGVKFPSEEKPMYWKIEGPATKDIGKIDFVLLSHDQHGDNLDHAGRELLKQVSQTFTTKVGAERLKGNAKGLSDWESVSLRSPQGDDIQITATPARHGPSGIEKITGDVIGFLVDVKGKENFQLYITGDTVFFEGVSEVAKKYTPQYIFINAGAAKPRGPFHLTMSANDALDTAFAFPGATIVPLHVDGWSHFTESAADLQKSFAALGIPERLHVLRAGVPTEMPIPANMVRV